MKHTAQRLEELFVQLQSNEIQQVSEIVQELQSALQERNERIAALEELEKLVSAAAHKNSEAAHAANVALSLSTNLLAAAQADKAYLRESLDHYELTSNQRTPWEEAELQKELERLKDRNNELEKQAGDYRVKIGQMEEQVPALKLHEDLVPSWVKEKIKNTRWEIIAHPEGEHRTTIGIRTHLVHCRANKEFESDRSECWTDVLAAAFYWADVGRETRGDKEVLKLQAQIDRMVEDGLKAAEVRIAEVYAQQQALVESAFQEGKKKATARCIEYVEGMASSSLALESAHSALTVTAQDLRRGEHDKYAVEQTTTIVPVAKGSNAEIVIFSAPTSYPTHNHILHRPGVLDVEPVFNKDELTEGYITWSAKVLYAQLASVLSTIRAIPGVKDVYLPPERKAL